MTWIFCAPGVVVACGGWVTRGLLVGVGVCAAGVGVLDVGVSGVVGFGVVVNSGVRVGFGLSVLVVAGVGETS